MKNDILLPTFIKGLSELMSDKALPGLDEWMALDMDEQRSLIYTYILNK